MSTSVTTYPIVAALVKAEGMSGMGSNRLWQATNDTQRHFLQNFFDNCRGEVGYIPEIDSIASWTVEDINTFLQLRGFTIKLQPFGGDTFGVASVLDLLVEWPVKGEVTTLQGIDRKTYPGVRISGEGVKFFKAYRHDYPIAMLETKTRDRVYMTMLDRNPSDGFDLVERKQKISHGLTPLLEYDGLIFPMVDMDQNVDIGWLLGMHTRGKDGQPARITQALQQTILKMNAVGARAKSAVAVAVTRSIAMPKPDVIINGPFLIWFERDGVTKPFFVGHITQEHWCDPGSIK